MRIATVLNDQQALTDFILAAAVFLLFLSLWIAVVMLWARRRLSQTSEIKHRLGIKLPTRKKKRVLRLWHAGEQASTTVPVTVEARSLLKAIDRYCRKAGWTYGPGPMIALVGGVTALSTVFTMLVTANLWLSAAVGIALLITIRIYLEGRIASRAALFEAQLVDAMELAARSLRAGHPLLGAFQLISQELAQPVSAVFGEVCQMHEMGASLGASLQEMARSSASSDMNMFATSIAIQLRAGGNLADLMDRLAQVIRERARLNRRVNVLTAQTQMSKRVLVVLPFLIVLAFHVMNPDYMLPLYTTSVGRAMLGIAAAGLAIGIYLMNRMASVKY